MAQIIDPVPSYLHDRIVCCYVNATSKIQIARITNIPNWYFERVVFPGQHLIFEALPEALLEIHSGMMASAILSDTILCDRLRMEEQRNEAQQRQDTKKIEDPYEPNTRGTTHKNPIPTPSLKALALSAAE
ncbi:MAG TPA: DUF1830 domain-containing protein [Oscillatoriaceae cyanobacterium M33_DOE_052]|uniref:DUF1830 domain-containing protein n=1 Tax=Planktothricoides sp. SpSt-374 TaxID=2282167 RepID=A0A7C3VIW9_9CYAN|nr:DUF1830 domain-containing protein [Oscillatoriaceae cyanobacterium M33_DOE_052]